MDSEVECPYCDGQNGRRAMMIRNLHAELVCAACGHVERDQGECNCDGCERRREAEYLRQAEQSKSDLLIFGLELDTLECEHDPTKSNKNDKHLT